MAETMASLNKDDSKIYSTEETIIGTWLGKTLYGRTFTGTSPSVANTNTNLPHTITAEMRIKKMDGMITRNDGTQYPINTSFADGSTISTWRRNSTTLGMAVYQAAINCPYEITIEYTKS